MLKKADLALLEQGAARLDLAAAAASEPREAEAIKAESLTKSLRYMFVRICLFVCLLHMYLFI